MNYIKKLMEDNNIEVNEEFYIINEKGDKIENPYDGESFLKFYFTENLEFKSEAINLICNKVLLSLMLGECKIEKIQHKQKTVWDLKNGDEYYYINMCGNVDLTTFSNDTYNADKKIIEVGNAFLTKEEAKHEAERRKCEAVLLKYGTRNFMSFEYYDDKYYIMYNNTVENVYVDCCNFMQRQGSIYFKTEELAQKAIEEVGEDRLKKYVFNVKE